MKKFGGIFLMSCLLSLMPMIFSGEASLQLERHTGDTWQLMHQTSTSRFANPIPLLDSPASHDSSSVKPLLDVLELLKSNPTQVNELPSFRVDLLGGPMKNRFQLVFAGKCASYGDETLSKLFHALLERDKCSTINFIVDLKKIATIQLCAAQQEYNPGNPNQAASGENGLTKLITEMPSNLGSPADETKEGQETKKTDADQPQNPAPHSLKKMFACLSIGTIVGILGFYTFSKLEYCNIHLAPAIDAKLASLFTYLTNRLRA